MIPAHMSKTFQKGVNNQKRTISNMNVTNYPIYDNPVKAKNALINRLYGKGVMQQPLPSIKRPFERTKANFFQIQPNKAMSQKRTHTFSLGVTKYDYEGEYRKENLQNKTFIGHMSNLDAEIPFTKDIPQKLKINQSFNQYSIQNSSITGNKIMSSLKPTQIRSRCSIYTSKMGISTGIRRSHHQAKSTASRVLDISRPFIDRKKYEEENENMLKDYLRNKAIISKMQAKPFNSKDEEKYLSNMFAQKKQAKEGGIKGLKSSMMGEEAKELREQEMYKEKGEEFFGAGDIGPTIHDRIGRKDVSNLPEEEKEEWTNIDTYIDMLLEFKDSSESEFIYLNQNNSNPYDLEITKFKKRNTRKHYTLSSKGIALFIDDVPKQFVSLGNWLKEREYYNKIRGISFFNRFRRWKVIKVWRKNIIREKRKIVSDQLEDKLFFLDDVFREHLLKHKALMFEMSKLKFVDIGTQSQPQTLDEFIQAQIKIRTFASEKVKEFSEKARENFRAATSKVLSKLRTKIINEKNQEDEAKAS